MASSLFVQAELRRLLTRLSECDPATNEYNATLYALSQFTHLAADIDAIAKEIGMEPVVLTKAEPKLQSPVEEDKVVPFPAPADELPFDVPEPEVKDETPEPEPPAAPAVTLTKEEVRAALAKARKDKGINIPQFLQQNFGCSTFSELPEGKYEECVVKLGEA